MTDSGIAALNARISAIQTQFVPPTTPTRSNSAPPTGAASFSNAMDRALATTATASARATATPTAQKVIDIAKQWIGTPYVYGGNDPEKGLDCSGLVQQAFKRVGIDLPRVTYDQVKQGSEVASIAEAQPGDLIFKVGDRGQRVNGHVGIYLGEGKWLEAPYTGEKVRITDVPKELTAIRRVIPNEMAAATPPVAVSAAGTASSKDDMSTKELLTLLLPLMMNNGALGANSAVLAALQPNAGGRA